MTAAAPPGQTARGDVREGLRDVLTSAHAFNALEPGTRKDIARALVKIGSTALDLAEEEERAVKPVRPRQPLAVAQSQPGFGAATDRLAQTTRDTLNAVSFPRFVSELITGVFKAMNDSNQQQLTAFVDLIKNVAASTEGFADANIGNGGARTWLAETFPGSFAIEGGSDPEFDRPQDMSPEDRAEWEAENAAEQQLVLVSGGTFPSEGALRSALGLPEGQSIPTGDPESLVPLARSALARNKQQMLATMVQMGLQRIVIESGRLNASMRFHVDTSSVANEDRGSQFDMRNTVEAGANASVGPWGASAKVQNTIGFVSTNRAQNSEEINTELDLDSGVELIFRTDYLPLDRLAGGEARERIRVNAINPEAEATRIDAARTARAERRETDRTARRDQLDSRLQTPEAPAPMTPIEVPQPQTPPSDGSSADSSTAAPAAEEPATAADPAAAAS
ncbi:hypothetical protein [Erythrobacter sp. EC-HK427]|uniref:hypothetical protein n=1 Tax=Erythrobacter sp. EC-HK427 TaxID=2038396 RepID=UPI001256AC2E|nr:hypothetical protein [Erythrobacter sp. EC-HK427]VVT12219.1 conserved hypothetical protein [Erythrobacter sp. EC-HK427]